MWDNVIRSTEDKNERIHQELCVPERCRRECVKFLPAGFEGRRTLCFSDLRLKFSTPGINTVDEYVLVSWLCATEKTSPCICTRQPMGVSRICADKPHSRFRAPTDHSHPASQTCESTLGLGKMFQTFQRSASVCWAFRCNHWLPQAHAMARECCS